MVPRPTPATFRELYREHYGFVWHAARRFGVAEALLDDAVQDTFVTAYRRMDAWRGDGARPWLYGIARRVASNYRRADHRRARRHQAVATGSSTDVALPDLEALLTIDTFLGSLVDDLREVFVLAEIEGMSGGEVAATLDLPVSTTYDRIRAARARFVSHVQDRGTSIVARARDERPRATERSWNRLAAVLPAGKVAWWSTAGSSLWGAAATSGAVVAILWAYQGVTQPAAIPAIATASPVKTRSDEAPVFEPAAELPVATTAAVSPSPPIEVPPRRATAIATPPREEAPDTDETAWLTAAAGHLARGDAKAALELTDRHARHYRGSALADVRAALRIESLCKLGKAPQARAEAKQLLAARPSSPVASRVRSACDDSSNDTP